MKHILAISALFLTSFCLHGQSSYTGYIDKYPIEFVTDIYSDGVATAVYAYTNYDEPIVLNGKLQNGKLTLYETDHTGKNKAVLIFEKYDQASNSLAGIWVDLSSNKQFDIRVTKSHDIDQRENSAWDRREIMQSVSLKDRYFKLIISKQKDDTYAKVTGVKIIQKKSDRLLQQIDIECQLLGLNNISVADYNFDGMMDFSVFEQHYAGANTSSLYFLYNPQKNQYVDAGFSGVSLEFDPKSKRIYEHNQCCAGTSHMKAEYKVVNNKMILVKKTCLEYDEQRQDFKKVKCD